MAEEQTPATGQSSALVKKFVIIVGAVVVAAVVALVVYKFVLVRLLTEPEKTKEEPEVPKEAVMVHFGKASTTVLMPPNSDVPASLLMYTVAFLCSDLETSETIEKNKSWFTDMLRELHSDHPREELDKSTLRESIRRQALIKGNEILKSILGEESKKHRILRVFHDEFFVVDQ